MGFELDLGPLIQTIRLKAQVGTYGFEQVVNNAMRDVALKSIATTPAVSSSVIAEKMRSTIATRTVSKTGRTLKRPKHTYEATDAAFLIMVARLRKAKELKDVTEQEIRQLALAMANGRVRSGSYLKAGFLAAAQPFGGGRGADGVHLYHAPGGGKLATLDDLFAELHNDVPVAHWKDTPGGTAAYAAAEHAMQDGADKAVAGMLPYIDRKLREAGFDN